MAEGVFFCPACHDVERRLAYAGARTLTLTCVSGLSRRTPAAAGYRVQVRRAFLSAGDVVLSTTEVFDFTFARTRRVHWRRRHRWSVIRVLDRLCHRVGRAPTIGRPWLWRLKTGTENMLGYARVSTRDQNLAGQVAELTAAGCAKVYREKISGAQTDRAELGKVIGRLSPGTYWW